ncbi:hypothetical protein LINGRAHAP2_LOCUS23943 [Linum grandiflorum]
MGDFNATISNDEKSGGAPIRRESSEPFKRFIFDNNLMDLGFEGQRYTWTNYRREDGNIRVRLDQALCSPAWRLHFRQAILHHETMIGSDHTPILLNTQGRKEFVVRPFRFDARWNDHEDARGVISSSWDTQNDVHNKLMSLQSRLRTWSKSNIRNGEKEIKRIKERIKVIQEAVRTDANFEEERKLKCKLEQVSRSEEKYWSQKAKVNWLSLGDENTKFFHSSTIQRSVRNRITSIRMADDSLTCNKGIIKEQARTFFRTLFAARNQLDCQELLQTIPNIVSDEDNVDLCRPITIEEIKLAVFGMGGGKAPGPDGYSGNFFQKH